jgi:hypothetical protein
MQCASAASGTASLSIHRFANWSFSMSRRRYRRASGQPLVHHCDLPSFEVRRAQLSDFTGSHTGQKCKDIGPVQVVLNEVIAWLPNPRSAQASGEQRHSEDLQNLVLFKRISFQRHQIFQTQYVNVGSGPKWYPSLIKQRKNLVSQA